MISLNQLRTFLEVAATGSVGRAAERLACQPAVSSALASLQRELGATLVERSGRGLQITSAGRQVEADARRLFSHLEDLHQRARSAGAADGGRIRLAAVTTAAEHLVPPLMRGFRGERPAVTVAVEVANRSRVWDMLEHWEVDLAIAGRPPADRGFRTLATRPNDLVVVGSEALRGTAESLAEATWLLREPGSGTREATEELLAQMGISPPRLTIGSNGAIRESIRAGLGISLLSRDAVDRDVRSGSLVLIDAPATAIRAPGTSSPTPNVRRPLRRARSSHTRRPRSLLRRSPGRNLRRLCARLRRRTCARRRGRSRRPPAAEPRRAAGGAAAAR